MKEINPVGRPSGYTPEIGEEICKRIELGETLMSICMDNHMPGRSTVNQWIRLNINQQFTDNYANACETYEQNTLDQMSERAKAICGSETATALHIAAAEHSFKVESYRLGILNRRKYGKDAPLTQTVDIRHFYVNDDEKILERYAAKLLAARERENEQEKADSDE